MEGEDKRGFAMYPFYKFCILNHVSVFKTKFSYLILMHTGLYIVKIIVAKYASQVSETHVETVANHRRAEQVRRVS